ncbi:hypothetical protein MKY09_11120 [Psychrobacillus sp. FSL K6-4046]|uniref:hypothetical protein n=1 Tax=Psychrobacillus sp. FSL K6-4046 TaxID=2921550 RepID=UPI00315AAE67
MYNKLIDHGTPVVAEEERTAAICTKEQASKLVIAAKGFVLIIDLEKGTSKQVFFPLENKEYPFASFNSGGLFYTGAGKMLLVLDPFKECFVDYQVIENGEEIVGFSFAEDSEGMIYFTTYPHCHLLSYDSKSQHVVDYGSMHAEEKYPGTVALDTHGWAYMGIGTEKRDIIAYHLITGQKKSLLSSHQRQKGAGYVYLGNDGTVYGHIEASDLKNVLTASQWLKFSQGECNPAADVAPSSFVGTGFQKVHIPNESNYQIEHYSLSEGLVQISHKDSGIQKTIHLIYHSEGAELSSLFLAPDGFIYGTSMHPLQFFRYDPTKNSLQNFGALEKGGGGNICAYASHENLLVGVAYAGGKLYVYDLDQQSSIPRLVLEEDQIHRPRCALALSGTKEVIWGGFPGYGLVGGALAIYNMDTEKQVVIRNEDILPFHSTICLSELSNGDIIGGTSVEAPGGAVSKEQDARLYVLDRTTMQLKCSFVPFNGTREIIAIYTDMYNRVHGVTGLGMYFIWDTEMNSILSGKDLSSYGEPIRSGFVYDEPNHTLYCLMSNALIAIDVKQPCPEPILKKGLEAKASSGTVLFNGRVYYGSGSHLYSVSIE